LEASTSARRHIPQSAEQLPARLVKQVQSIGPRSRTSKSHHCRDEPIPARLETVGADLAILKQPRRDDVVLIEEVVDVQLQTQVRPAAEDGELGPITEIRVDERVARDLQRLQRRRVADEGFAAPAGSATDGKE
jgi:hypothetical protein